MDIKSDKPKPGDTGATTSVSAADTKIDVKSAPAAGPVRFEDLLKTQTRVRTFIWCAAAAVKVSHSYGDRWYSFDSDPGNPSRGFVGSACVPYDASMKYADMDSKTARESRESSRPSSAAIDRWWSSVTLEVLGVPNAVLAPSIYGIMGDGDDRVLVEELLRVLVERKIASPTYGRHTLHLCGIDFFQLFGVTDEHAWGHYSITCAPTTLHYDEAWRGRAHAHHRTLLDGDIADEAKIVCQNLTAALGDGLSLATGLLDGIRDLCNVVRDIDTNLRERIDEVNGHISRGVNGAYNRITDDIKASKDAQKDLDELLRKLPDVLYYNPDGRKFFTEAVLGEVVGSIGAAFAPDPKKMSAAQKLGPKCTVYVMGPALQTAAGATVGKAQQTLLALQTAAGATVGKAQQTLLTAPTQK